MENKYYTPLIEEFCVGFDYEAKCEDGTYNKRILDIKDLSILEEVFELLTDINELVRVKYLNRSDIEELGFIKSHDFSECIEYTYNTNEPIYYKLEYYNEDFNNEIWIEKYELSGGDDYNTEYIFKGNIKNKHELKVLLKQLNIIK